MTLRVGIRVDASVRMGIGHLKRCIALATALRRAGAELTFVIRDLGLDAAGIVKAAGFAVRPLPAPRAGHAASAGGGVERAHADWAGVPQALDAEQSLAALEGWQPEWIVVDSYAFDSVWHQVVQRDSGARLGVIDDLGDRDLNPTLLIDHNLCSDHRAKYAGRLAQPARILGGPRYALLDPRYADAAPYVGSDSVRSIGIFVGGTDPWDASTTALRACREVARFAGPIEIATTRANPHVATLRALAGSDRQLTLLEDADELSAFFARHDLQIGAGGGATWERCCVGAPTLAVVLADNQRASLTALAQAGAVSLAASADRDALGEKIAQLIAQPTQRAELAQRARALVDGRGATRVALAMTADHLTLRQARDDDARRSHGWRNAASTRRYFRDPSELAWEVHRRWWTACLADPQRHLFIAHVGGIDVGVLRMDCAGANAEVSLYLDPQLHGLGLGAALLRAGQDWAQGQPLTRLSAEILPGNEASAAAFDGAGFIPARAALRHWEVPR